MKVVKKAYLTQSVEYRFCKPKVIGSTPVVGFKFFSILKVFYEGGIVQWLEHWNHNPNAVGSNPSSALL